MDPLMRSHIVEIVQAVPIQNIRKMASPEDDDVIEALTTNAAKIALARCIHKRSPHCRSHDFHSSFVLATRRVSRARMRRPSIDNTARCFCSKSRNRSSLAEIRKFNDHVAEESNSQYRWWLSPHARMVLRPFLGVTERT